MWVQIHSLTRSKSVLISRYMHMRLVVRVYLCPDIPVDTFCYARHYGVQFITLVFFLGITVVISLFSITWKLECSHYFPHAKLSSMLVCVLAISLPSQHRTNVKYVWLQVILYRTKYYTAINNTVNAKGYPFHTLLQNYR